MYRLWNPPQVDTPVRKGDIVNPVLLQTNLELINHLWNEARLRQDNQPHVSQHLFGLKKVVLQRSGK